MYGLLETLEFESCVKEEANGGGGSCDSCDGGVPNTPKAGAGSLDVVELRRAFEF